MCLYCLGNTEHVTADVLQRKGWKHLLILGEKGKKSGGKMDGHLNIWKMNQQGRGGYYVSR